MKNCKTVVKMSFLRPVAGIHFRLSPFEVRDVLIFYLVPAVEFTFQLRMILQGMDLEIERPFTVLFRKHFLFQLRLTHE